MPDNVRAHLARYRGAPTTPARQLRSAWDSRVLGGVADLRLFYGISFQQEVDDRLPLRYSRPQQHRTLSEQ